MTDNRAKAGNVLFEILGRTDYIYFLARHVQQVGLHVGGTVFLLTLDAGSGKVSLRICDNADEVRPAFWVECELSALESVASGAEMRVPVIVRTGPIGQVMHPRIEQLLLRCFQPPPYPLDDREELIYPSLFGFQTPTVLWESQKSVLRVLQYTEPDTGSGFCVSSGLSEPWAWERAEIYGDGVSGAGYELVIRAAEPAIASEFSSWIQYVERSQVHILPGNWLEFQEHKLIPGTNIAGFLVVRPSMFLPQFPVGSSIAHWHYLIPVSPAQLDLAKQTDVFRVAEMIERGGERGRA